MPTLMQTIRQGLRYFWSEISLRDFSGGLDLRDAPPELAPTESPDMWNVTLDERGGVIKRLGYAKWNVSPYEANLVGNLYYWPTGQNLIVQAGPDLYLDTGGTIRKTFTTPARAAFTDFGGKVWAIHPIDGVFSSPDGITWTAIAGSPKGATITAWQNRLIAGGDPGAKATLYASAIGDGTDWTTAAGHGWTNQLRDGSSSGSDELIISVAGASGVDINGRPGLIVCKRKVTYRIYDSGTGAYQILDNSVGAASALSLVSIFGRIIILSPRGVFWTDGVGPLTQASLKIDPMFTDTQLAWDQLDLWCAGVKGDRVRFSMPRAGSTANNLAFEYHPLEGWFSSGSNAASAYTLYGKNVQKLLGGAPTVNGQVYEFDKTGSDDGAAIASRWQTRWLEPTSGHPIRIRRLRVSGNGVFTINVFRDYELAPDDTLPVQISGTAAVYDDPAALYDGPTVLYGPLKSEDKQDFMALGVAKAVSFQISETSTLSNFATGYLGGTATPEVGAWSMFGLDMSYVPLGLS